jgi:hypothetical protein
MRWQREVSRGHGQRTRRSVLGAAAASVALLATSGATRGFQNGGTISVQGFLCPSEDADLSDCQATDEIFNGPFVIAGPDGIVLTLNDGESHAVSHVWYGLPYGAYDFQALGGTPDGYALNRVDGATDDGGWGREVVLDDDNPGASVNLIYIPW